MPSSDMVSAYICVLRFFSPNKRSCFLISMFSRTEKSKEYHPGGPAKTVLELSVALRSLPGPPTSWGGEAGL